MQGHASAKSSFKPPPAEYARVKRLRRLPDLNRCHGAEIAKTKPLASPGDHRKIPNEAK
jgi:hypothetical protein